MEETGGPDPLRLLSRFPVGWSRATYAGRAWGVSRTSGVAGRVHRVYAEALAGSPRPDGRNEPGGVSGVTVVSANLYRVGDRTELRPCEMPAEVVLDFLEHAVPDQSPDQLTEESPG